MKKIVFFMLAVFFHPMVFSQSKVTAEKVGDKIEISVNGNLFTNYVLSEFEKYKSE